MLQEEENYENCKDREKRKNDVVIYVVYAV